MRPVTAKSGMKRKILAKPNPSSMVQGYGAMIDKLKSHKVNTDRPKSVLDQNIKQGKKELLPPQSHFSRMQNPHKLPNYLKRVQKITEEVLYLSLFICKSNENGKFINLSTFLTEKVKLTKNEIATVLLRIVFSAEKIPFGTSKCMQLSHDNPLVLFSMYQSLIYLIKERESYIRIRDIVLTLSLNDSKYWKVSSCFLISKSNVPIHRALGACLFTDIPEHPYSNDIMTGFCNGIQPKYVRISLISNTISQIRELIKSYFINYFKQQEIETIEYSIYCAQLKVNNLMNYLYCLILALCETSVNYIKQVKDIFIEIICQDNCVNLQKIKEFNAYFNLNRAKFRKIFKHYNIVMRFSHYSTMKKFIPFYIEKKLNYHKKVDSGYLLMYAKYSSTSPFRKLHRFIILRIIPFLIDLDYKYLPEKKVTIIHTFKEDKKKVVQKKK